MRTDVCGSMITVKQGDKELTLKLPKEGNALITLTEQTETGSYTVSICIPSDLFQDLISRMREYPD